MFCYFFQRTSDTIAFVWSSVFYWFARAVSRRRDAGVHFGYFAHKSAERVYFFVWNWTISRIQRISRNTEAQSRPVDSRGWFCDFVILRKLVWTFGKTSAATNRVARYIFYYICFLLVVWIFKTTMIKNIMNYPLCLWIYIFFILSILYQFFTKTKNNRPAFFHEKS